MGRVSVMVFGPVSSSFCQSRKERGTDRYKKRAPPFLFRRRPECHHAVRSEDRGRDCNRTPYTPRLKGLAVLKADPKGEVTGADYQRP